MERGYHQFSPIHTTRQTPWGLNMGLFDSEEGSSAPPKASPDLIKMIGQRFVSRKDVKAEQAADGAWHPVRVDSRDTSSATVPFAMQDFTDHLEGRKTYGHYVVGIDGTAKFWCMDLDLDKEGFYLGDMDPGADPDDIATIVGFANKCNPRDIWAAEEPADAFAYYTRTLRCLAEGLAQRAVRLGTCDHVAISNSGGKGLHVYGFMTKPTPADVVREMAVEVLTDVSKTLFGRIKGDNFWKANTAGAYSNVTIEVFPKQDSVSNGGFGNLLRLPLGINRKTGKRGYFVNCKSGLNRLPEMDAMRALSGDLPWE